MPSFACRAKDRADARMLAQAKAKKPKIMRELEGMSVMKLTASGFF